jgi:hypothetical protein
MDLQGMSVHYRVVGLVKGRRVRNSCFQFSVGNYSLVYFPVKCPGAKEVEFFISVYSYRGEALPPAPDAEIAAFGQ